MSDTAVQPAPDLDRLRDRVDRHLQANYRAIRAERDWSWEDLAADLDRQASSLPPEHAFPYELIARWARAEAAAEPTPAEREGTTPQPATPRPKRTTQQPAAPRRTA